MLQLVTFLLFDFIPIVLMELARGQQLGVVPLPENLVAAHGDGVRQVQFYTVKLPVSLDVSIVLCYTMQKREGVLMSGKTYSLEEIKEIVAPIAKVHGVDRVYLFGSYARGEATSQSDIDLCIDAAAIRGMFAMGGLYADLEEALRKRLDIITVRSLKYNKDTQFLENMQRDRILIYEAA